jgi:endonuclease/exonuclease/phosphatase family metal-dependent hydrolase
MSQLKKPEGVVKINRTGRILFFINILAAILLLISQASSSINPIVFWPVGIFANLYPVFLLINICFLIYWGLRRHRLIVLSAAIILIGYDKCTMLYQPAIAKFDVKPPKNSFKILSYNVRLFDLYNWTGNLKTRKKIFDYLYEEHPDILCFQEYFHSDEGDFQNNQALRNLLKLPYSSIKYSITLRKAHHWGIATFSKYPIINEGTLFFTSGKSNFCLYSDLVINQDTIRVYNTHLQSNHFKKTEYDFIENTDSLINDKKLKNTKSILRRIRTAVIKRSEQADILRAHIEKCPYPVLICGDFNDTPYSYPYQTIRKDLKDSFTEKGEGFGNTYFSLFVKFRIDYILHSSEFKTYSFHTKEVKLSDHYPIQTWLSLP